MKIMVDTSVIVDIDRKDEFTIGLIKNLLEKDADLFLSTITVSEILTGCYLREDYTKAIIEAKRILSQFLWIDFDSIIAEKTGEYTAYLIKKGNVIEYQDIAIAATFKIISPNYLLTLNKYHFAALPDLKDKVFTPKELASRLSS